MCFRYLLVLMMVLFFAASPVLAADDASIHKWKMATSWPGGPFFEQAEHFAKRVNELTEGRVQITVFAGGALGNPLKVSETVKNGVAESGHTWAPYDWGKDKTTILFPSWAGGPDSEALIHWLYEGGGTALLQEYRMDKFGVISFPAIVIPAEIFLHSKKPVKTLEDFKGLKIRTTGAWIEIVEKLGASPVTASGAEVYQMLERGVIDATEWASPSGNLPIGFHKIAPYIIIPGIHQPANMLEVIVNPRAWGKLSAHDKLMIELAAKLSVFEVWMQSGKDDMKAMEQFTANGNIIIELDQSVIDKSRFLAEEWAIKQATTNEWFARVWESQKAFMADWKKAERYR